VPTDRCAVRRYSAGIQLACRPTCAMYGLWMVADGGGEIESNRFARSNGSYNFRFGTIRGLLLTDYRRVFFSKLGLLAISNRFPLFGFLPARRYASSGTNNGPVCLTVCLSQVGVLSKRMNELSWFWHGGFLLPILHCVKRKFGCLQK